MTITPINKIITGSRSALNPTTVVSTSGNFFQLFRDLLRQGEFSK
jgi:hypothetical protein